MNIMAPTVYLMAQTSGYGDRRTAGDGHGRTGDSPGRAQNPTFVGSTSVTSREATINAADILKAVVEGTRMEPPPRRSPVPDETAVSPRDLVKLELIRTLLGDPAAYVGEPVSAQNATDSPSPGGHVDVLA